MKERTTRENIASVWDKTPGIIRLLLIYALLNGVIYFGQEMYYLPSTNRMNQLNSETAILDSEITSLESNASPEGLAEPYYSQYTSKIDNYNSKINEYNDLSKKSSSRWWLLPIPIPGGHAKTAL